MPIKDITISYYMPIKDIISIPHQGRGGGGGGRGLLYKFFKLLYVFVVIKLLKWVRTKLPSRLLNRIGPYYLYFRLKSDFFCWVYYAHRALRCYYLVYYLWRLWCWSSSRFRVNWRNAWLGFNRRFNWWWWSDFRLHWLTKENTTHTLIYYTNQHHYYNYKS